MDNQAFQLLKEKLDELGADIRSIRKDVDSVKNDLGHYKGFLGGMAFVFSVAWSGITYVISHLGKNS